jgi:chromate transporter
MMKLKDNRYYQLALVMLRTGLLGYGGGPAVVPLLRYEAVQRYRWLDDDEFGEIFAVANTLPGPILTKLAAYLGYKLKGPLGAAAAVIIQIMPSALAMIALMSLVHILSSSPIISGMIAAVTPVIAVMLGLMAYEFVERSVKGLGKWLGISLFVVSFVLLQVVHIHPGIVVSFFLVYGAYHFKTLKLLSARRKKGDEG